MKCASACTSAVEKFSSRLHFGMSACILAANSVASPRCSRWASCCGRSGIAPDYAGTPPRTRRRFTASPSASSTARESSQPRQASVMLWPKRGARKLGARRLDAARIVVRLSAAAQDDVAILVAARLDDGHLAALVHRQKVVLLPRGEQRVDRDLDVAVGAILESHRGREPGGEFAMHLAFGGARTDRAPRHEVADVLRRNHVQELAPGGHAELVDAHQQ